MYGAVPGSNSDAALHMFAIPSSAGDWSHHAWLEWSLTSRVVDTSKKEACFSSGSTVRSKGFMSVS
eukprot:5386328-Pleurochrysis_carterae.AAC.1